MHTSLHVLAICVQALAELRRLRHLGLNGGGGDSPPAAPAGVAAALPDLTRLDLSGIFVGEEQLRAIGEVSLKPGSACTCMPVHACCNDQMDATKIALMSHGPEHPIRHATNVRPAGGHLPAACGAAELCGDGNGARAPGTVAGAGDAVGRHWRRAAAGAAHRAVAAAGPDTPPGACVSAHASACQHSWHLPEHCSRLLCAVTDKSHTRASTSLHMVASSWQCSSSWRTQAPVVQVWCPVGLSDHIVTPFSFLPARHLRNPHLASRCGGWALRRRCWRRCGGCLGWRYWTLAAAPAARRRQAGRRARSPPPLPPLCPRLRAGAP